MGSLEKCGRTVLEIVSPTDDSEAIKMGLPWLPGCYSNFLVYKNSYRNNKLEISGPT